MTPKTMHTTTVVRILSAVGAVGLQLSIPSLGIPADLDNSQPALSVDAASAIDSAVSPIEEPARSLTAIDIQRNLQDVSVTIAGDGSLLHEANLVAGRRLVIDVPNVTSTIRKPVWTVNHPLLRRVRVGTYAEKVRVVLDMNADAEYAVQARGNSLVVSLKGNVADQSERVESGDRQTLLNNRAEMLERTANLIARQEDVRTVRTSNLQRIPAAFRVRPAQMMVGGEESEKSTPKEDLVLGETRYVGRRISLDFQQADISNVLRLIAEVSGFNIVVGEGVKSKVTMKLVSVPWDQALDMILKMNGLGKIRQGNILWVDSLSNIARQEDEEARAKDAKTKAEELVDRVFYVRNLQAQELMTALRQNLSPRGVMQISQGTNALVVRDTESKMNVLKQLIDGLDLAVPQVQIEARIVQADTTYSRSLGVQWGVQNLNSGQSFGVANFRSGTAGPFGAQTSDFLVNLPATVGGLVTTPGAGFTFGKADGAMLDVRLSAGELLGLSKVIAAPKVTTLDKREAKISQGESIPFQTTSLQGTQTTFVDANLELNVTPQITSRDPKEIGKQILMRVRATRNAVGARSNPAGPSIDRREANTQVIIRDGETMVIGGVFIDTQNNNVAGVPYLSRIPVLGWLFKSKSESVAKQELLIFLTPSIVKT
ncbi:putative Type IV pili biogenesis protein PilQ [Nitrospira japonica]|uniref:Putative Type IV pili biogenesis protein PilQ n=1 Tax=Nitrospira japonica TaxID=1325564 RepID=A0A1W1I6R1_9BACT|nr:type IV pilus secretin family protein [Nitrospira japonica]SLM48549.1 putative Type IV pili biogenesis protein PilQ [Nitrospira japonica]